MGVNSKIVWGITILLSILYIVIGNRISTKDFQLLNGEGDVSEKAQVVSVDQEFEETQLTNENTEAEATDRIFTCKVLSGENKGELLKAVQMEDVFGGISDEPVQKGDQVIVYNYPTETDTYRVDWVFGSFMRFNGLVIFSVIILVLLLLLGKKKGVNTILSLIFTCAAIFGVFIPSILSGQNIYANTLITCTFITIMTLLLTNGWSKKTLATILGCLFGVMVAALLSRYLDSALSLTGYVDEHSIYLADIPTKNPIDLRAVIFAGVVIGALGAVMDVAMDIASALYELKQKVPKITNTGLIRSGINIGRDIMGTMSNTLILAYIGSSLSTVLLLITYAANITELLNREMIVVDLMQALIGSSAILLTIPLTAVICGLLYINHQNAPRHLQMKSTVGKIQRNGKRNF